VTKGKRSHLRRISPAVHEADLSNRSPILIRLVNNEYDADLKNMLRTT